MSLKAIVEVLGGDLYDHGARANIPAPGHSTADRSVSLLLRDGRVIVHTFGDGDWRAVLDHLRSLGLVDAGNAPLSLGRSRAVGAAPPTGRERLEAAARLWEGGRPLAGMLSERHCRLRAIHRQLPGPDTMRHSPEAPVAVYGESRRRRPALLVRLSDADGRFTAVEVTYLAANGRRALDLRLPRKTIGPVPAGSAVRIDPEAPDILVAEGVFTALSASERFDLPGWALLSTSNLRRWSPPAIVRSVLIAADRGKDGESSAARLRDRLAAKGLAVAVALPPEPYGDWNEWSVGERVRDPAHTVRAAGAG
jgi:hypothetical protein